MKQPVELAVNEAEILSLMDSRLIAPRLPSRGEQLLIDRTLSQLNIALHCWLKRWNKKHIVPAKASLTKLLEPEVEYLSQLYTLCAMCHASRRQAETVLPYKDGAEWFAHVIQEFRQEVANQKFSDTDYWKAKGNHKDRFIRDLQAQLKQARNGEDPFDPNAPENRFKFHHFSLLLKAAISLADDSKEFEVRFWKPFLKAWDGRIKMLQNHSFKRHQAIGDNVYAHLGGRQKRRVL